MALKQSSRGAIPPFIVMDVMRAANERAASGADVLHLEVGQPATAAPKAVLEAAARALADDRIAYTEAFGLPDLRRRIARHYRDRYGVDVEEGRIAVTTGSSGGFLLGFLAAFDPGERVALAAPGYPAYRNILAALGNRPVLLPSEAEHRFQPTPELLERLDEPIAGLIVASPSNPTGTMVDRGHMKALVDYCAERAIRLVSDEIYHGISYGEAPVSALELTGDAIVINSFSKYFSMTGWRLGWMVVPQDLLRPVECLAQNFFISPPTLSQLAGLAAFDCCDELDGHVARYTRNRALLLRELPKAGLDRLAPADGAFYIYANVSRLTNDSEEFCRRMLAETGVAATPGVDFDPERGNRFVRFSFAGAESEIAEAGRRLQVWLAGRGS
ncbi:MAG: aminotransferase class I/II-fold pyridoxal phosphate-dependent enzyme [Kiloniellales bacterium]